MINLKIMKIIFPIFLLVSCYDHNQLNIDTYENNTNNILIESEINGIDDFHEINIDSINNSLILYNIYEFFQQIYPNCNNSFNYINKFSKEGWDLFTNETGINIKEHPDGQKLWLFNDITRFNKIYTEILAGTMPSVIIFNDADFPFYVKNDLLIPLIIYPFINNDCVLSIKYNEKIYGYGLYSGVDSTLAYSKEIIDKYGILDPLKLWKEGKWSWDTWLDLLSIVNNNIINDNINLLYGNNLFIHELATSNGVEYILVDEMGKFVFALDDKYIEVNNFYNDMVYEYKYIDEIMENILYVFLNVKDNNYENINKFFMINSNELFYLYYNMLDENNNIYKWPVNINKVCFPKGPSLSDNFNTRIRSKNEYYGIPSNCKNPNEAQQYIEWLFSDQTLLDNRKKLLIEYLYGGSEDLFECSVEWNSFATSSSFFNWGMNIGDIIRNNDSSTLINEKGKEIQEILDTYINIYL